MKRLILAAILSVHLLAAPALGTLTEEHIQILRDNGVTVTDNGDTWQISSDGIPDHEYGPFPGPGNPNTVTSQDASYTIPKVPTVAAEPGCLGMGAIGVAKNGIPLFNPYSAEGYNAVEGEGAETFDDCNGHPQQQGEYHYHQIPNCVYEGNVDEFMGFAKDGFPIYGPLTKDDTTGITKTLTTADLDDCHGQTRDGKYEYRMTYDFPYILGCYMGEVAQNQGPDGGARPRPPYAGGMNQGWSSCYADCEDPVIGCDDDGDDGEDGDDGGEEEEEEEERPEGPEERPERPGQRPPPGGRPRPGPGPQPRPGNGPPAGGPPRRGGRGGGRGGDRPGRG